MALLADSADFFADAMNYAASIFVLGMPLRVRAKLSLAKGALMGLIGLAVLAGSVYSFFVGATPDAATIGWVALMALLANISAGVILYRHRSNDSNALSVWLCTRNDAIGNLAVLLSALMVTLTASAAPDLLVAGFLAVLALHSSHRIIRLSLVEMQTSRQEI